MRIRSVKIRNYKGIKHCEIDISGGAPGNISTLIGLNESGKTTILEAISRFVSEDADIANVFRTINPERPLSDLVPKDRKADFTDHISIEATIDVEEADVVLIEEFFQNNHELKLNTRDFTRRITVEKRFSFVASKHTETMNYWSLTFPLKSKKEKKFTEHNHLEPTRAIWLEGIRFIAKLFPTISYFPTFSLDFPDRIYLEEHENETATNKYYRQVLQDILDSQGEGLRIEKHVVERVRQSRAADSDPISFWFRFFKTDEKAQVDAVMRKIANEMGRVIFGAWDQVFDRRISNKQIFLQWNLDVDKRNITYVQIYIIDGQSQYALAERSLGFRWFFAFLLFTQFRSFRRDSMGTIFLFDEPASNLHAKAQMQLLKSFPKIATGNNQILYSTHSHYMIEPLWLERAYIVDNKAIDYEDKGKDLDYFSTKPTDIQATKYRRFVGENSTRTTYFQPVLDKLKYVASPLVGSRDCIVLEGKLDFHPMQYFLQAIGPNDRFDIVPASGAESVDVLISLFVGWGRRFVILLDDDKAGRRARDRYLKEWPSLKDSVATLGDLVSTLSGKKFEALYPTEVTAEIQKAYGLASRPKKGDYSIYFQEKLARGEFDVPFGNKKGLLSSLSDAICKRMPI